MFVAIIRKGGIQMKAIQIKEFGGPEVLNVVEIPEPIPAANEVRVLVHAAGVNPNEAYARTGTYGAYIPELPYTPGFDGAGVIDMLGEGVTGFKPGDRVYIGGFMAKRNTGTYAEKVVVDAASVHPLTDELTFEQGASLGIPGLAAYQSVVLRAQVKEGDTVLIHGGSGAVGLTAIQIAKALGAKVIGTASTEEGRKLIRALGADVAMPHVVNGQYADIMAATDQQGPDVIIEMLANQNLETDLEIARNNARIVILGSRGSIQIDPRHTMTKALSILGMSAINLDAAETAAAYAALTQLVDEGEILPLVGDVLDLEKASEAHEQILTKKGNGKLVLKIK